VQAGYGLRPDPSSPAYSQWLAAASVPGRLLEAKRSEKHSHTVTSQTLPWWVGAVMTGAPNYISVVAAYVVPFAVPGGDQTSTTAIALWGGVGGFGTGSGLIQAGVNVSTTPTIATYSSWREYCCGDPNSNGYGGNFVPNPGDGIYSQVWYCDSVGNLNINGGYGCSYVIDTITGATFSCTSASGSPCWSVQALPLCSASPTAPNCMTLGLAAEFVIEDQSPQVFSCSTAFSDIVGGFLAGSPAVTMQGFADSSTAPGAFQQTISTDPSVVLLKDFTNATTQVNVALGGWDETYFTVSKSPDLHIQELRLQNGWQEADLSSISSPSAFPAAGAPSAYVTPDNIPRVVYRGTDGHIHELRLQGGWQQADLSAISNPAAFPAACDPFAYVTPDQVPRVIYLGGDSHIHELRLQGGWQHADLSAIAAGNPVAPAAGALFAYVTPDKVPRVVYLATDNHIHELRLQGGWQHADLSALVTNSPPAFQAVGSPLAFVTPDGIPRVDYLGADNHIHELRLQGGWQQADLSAISTPPASAAAGNPFAYVTPDNVPRVVYQGTDNHIHELRLQAGWQHADLSALVTDSPPAFAAASAPFAYVTPDQIPRVAYRGTDGHIHELRLQGSWQQADLSAISNPAAPAAANPAAPVSSGSSLFAYVTTDGIPRVVYVGP
jgi:Fungal fucose-specific lectin